MDLTKIDDEDALDKIRRVLSSCRNISDIKICKRWIKNIPALKLRNMMDYDVKYFAHLFLHEREKEIHGDFVHSD